MATLGQFVGRKFREWRAGGVECVGPGNLLGLRVGSVLAINDPDVEAPLRVVGVNMITETIGDRTYSITEYILEGESLSVWVYPSESRRSEMLPILFRETWRGTYGEAMREGLYHPAYDVEGRRWRAPHPETDAEIPALQDPEGLFRDHLTGALYRRRFDDILPHRITIRSMRDEDGNGRVDHREVAEFSAQYWDYERAEGIDDPLLFAVEDNCGMFRLLMGREVPFAELTMIC